MHRTIAAMVACRREDEADNVLLARNADTSDIGPYEFRVQKQGEARIWSFFRAWVTIFVYRSSLGRPNARIS
jgi:hypothetical protein